MVSAFKCYSNEHKHFYFVFPKLNTRITTSRDVWVEGSAIRDKNNNYKWGKPNLCLDQINSSYWILTLNNFMVSKYDPQGKR